MIKKVIYIFIILIVLVGTFWFLSQPPKDMNFYENPDLIFYWGDGCPHCETVKKWLTENNQNSKIRINSKEVYKNAINSKELSDTVDKYCSNLKQDGGIGVPTAFDPINQKCLQGSDEIINFLSQKLTN